ncbi:hypothetical protein [Streptomyces sp. NPDC089799]|uniref:hypothetical protein n=1 Tax=Streptomyces sp. NPDC089799 TaxID=3155066 RepID=UPI00343C3521
MSGESRARRRYWAILFAVRGSGASTGRRQACTNVPLPALSALTWDQGLGRSCLICVRRLTRSAVPRGLIGGQQGAHRLDTEVWACPRSGVAS